jgi:hypothetical protein
MAWWQLSSGLIRTTFFGTTGLVSVLGTSFTFVPIARTSIGFMMQEDSSNVCTTDADCTMAWANIPGIAIPGETNKG